MKKTISITITYKDLIKRLKKQKKENFCIINKGEKIKGTTITLHDFNDVYEEIRSIKLKETMEEKNEKNRLD